MSAQTSNDSGSLLTTKCAICKMSFGTRRVLSPPSQRHSKRESPSRRLRGLINTLWIFPDSSSIHQTPLLQELQNPSASGCMERVSGGSKKLHKNRACLCTGLCERINTPSFFALITILSLSFSLSKLHGHSRMECDSAFLENYFIRIDMCGSNASFQNTSKKATCSFPEHFQKFSPNQIMSVVGFGRNLLSK
jgi:hypothetical protein